MPNVGLSNDARGRSMSADLSSSNDTENVSAQLVWACNGGVARLRGWSWVSLEALSYVDGFRNAHPGGMSSARL